MAEQWIRHHDRTQKPLRKGEIIRMRVGGRTTRPRYIYGKAVGGFGMDTKTIGGAIYVEPCSRRPSIKRKEKWHRDHDEIQRRRSSAYTPKRSRTYGVISKRTRKFGGKVFKYDTTFPNKSTAELYRLARKDVYGRITKSKYGYDVWTRRKR